MPDLHYTSRTPFGHKHIAHKQLFLTGTENQKNSCEFEPARIADPIRTSLDGGEGRLKPEGTCESPCWNYQSQETERRQIR